MASHCEVCGAREACMLLQRREEREAADEAKHEPSLKSLKRLWDDSAHAMFAAKRTVADLDFTHDVITVKDTDTVEKGMAALINHHVSSVPVVPVAGGAPLGFLDTADVCAIIVHGHAIDGDVDTDAFSSFRSLLMRAEMHANKVRDVIGVSHIDPFLPLDEGSPLLQVRGRATGTAEACAGVGDCDPLTRLSLPARRPTPADLLQAVCILGDSVASPDGKAIRVHRIPIVNADGRVVQIVSQSAILRYLEEVSRSAGHASWSRCIVANVCVWLPYLLSPHSTMSNSGQCWTPTSVTRATWAAARSSAPKLQIRSSPRSPRC